MSSFLFLLLFLLNLEITCNGKASRDFSMDFPKAVTANRRKAWLTRTKGGKGPRETLQQLTRGSSEEPQLSHVGLLSNVFKGPLVNPPWPQAGGPLIPAH